MQKIRLSDIAELAGVSRAAVGKVLNGGRAQIRVGAETRQRILAAAEKLQYRPNMAASILAGGDSKLIGIFVDSHASYRTFQIHHEVEQLCSEQGYRLISCFSHNSVENMRKDYCQLQDYGVNKFICCAHGYPDQQKEIGELFSGAKNVVFMEKPSIPDMPYVRISRRHALKELIADTHRMGYKKIGLCTGYQFWQSERQLQEDFCYAMQQNKLDLAPHLIVQYQEELPLSGQIEKIMETVILPYRPDFLFIDDAVHAAALQRCLLEQGLRIKLYGGNDDRLFEGLGLQSLDPCYRRIAQTLMDLLLKGNTFEEMPLVQCIYRNRIA